MKLILLITGFLLLAGSLTVQAQDKIIRKDGTTLNVRILGTDNTYIRYKRFDNLTGPDYYIYKAEVTRFEYEKKPDPVAPPVVAEKKPEPVTPKPEVVKPQPQAAVVQPSAKPMTANPELAALEQKLAKYKAKSTLNTALGAGAIVGGIITFVVVNGAYGTYKSQLEGTNSSYTSWYTSNYGNAPNASDLAQPKGLFSFGSPGVYAAAAGLVGGAILTIWGRKNASLAKETNRQLEQRRKQVSVAPFMNGTTQFAGLHLKMTF